MEDLNATTSVKSLMNIIVGKESEHQERALQLLARKFIETEARKPLYAADNIEKLSEVVKAGTTYFSQLYALECLSWGAQDKLGLSREEVSKLRKVVRDPTSEELAALVTSLDEGSEQEKDDALLLCACVGTMASFESFKQFKDKLIPRIVRTLKDGNDSQKHWAAYALSNFASNEDYRKTVVYEDSIPLCVGLVRSGTDGQKLLAALTLGNMADNFGVQAEVVREGGIPALVALISAGTDEQQWIGTYVLSILALEREIRPKIARKGAIPPLVKLAQSGVDDTKRWAANALGNLAYGDEANGEAITEAGGVPALVALVQSGTDDQKQWAAYALGNLASSSSVVKDALRSADVENLLDGLQASESAEVRDAAKKSLDQVRKHGKVRRFLDNLQGVLGITPKSAVLRM